MRELLIPSSLEVLSPPWSGHAVLGVAGLGFLIVIGCVVLIGFTATRDDRHAALTRHLLLVGSALVAQLAGLYAVTACAMVFRVQPGVFTVLLSTSLVFALCVGIARFSAGVALRDAVAMSALSVAAIVLSCSFSGLFYDVSWDGQWYHQEALLQIHEGWNPIHEPELHEPELSKTAWGRHYPKASWYIAAAVMSVTGRVETGKAPAVALLVAGYLLSTVAVYHALPMARGFAPLLGGVIALNPVATTQWATFYVDGQIASLMTILIAAAVIAHRLPVYWVVCLMTSISAAILLSGLKFTGLLYAVLLLIGVAPLYWLSSTSVRRSGLGALSAVSSMAVAVVLFGFNPYVTNQVSHGHPLHPVAGDARIDVIANAARPSFLGRGGAEKLAISTFSEPGSIPGFSTPLGISRKALSRFYAPDVRHGGFGPWFSAGLIGALACVPGMVLHRCRMKDHRTLLVAIWLVAILAVSIVANPAAWWSRFVPQFWILAVGVALVALADGFLRESRGIRVLAAATLAILLVNGVMVAAVNTYAQVIASEQMDHVLDAVRTLQAEDGAEVHLGPSSSRSVQRRFDEAGLRYGVTERGMRQTDPAQSFGLSHVRVEIPDTP